MAADLITFDEARRLTEEIKTGVENLWVLIRRAHDSQAHKALSYDSWEDYCRREFDMSKQRSYQLLEFSRLVEVLDIKSTTVDSVSEGTLRPLTRLESPEEQREAFAEAVKVTNGKPTAKAIAAVVAAKRVTPIEAHVMTPAQQERVDEAEKDSETLWLLKSYWRKATKKERAAFREWMEQQGSPHETKSARRRGRALNRI